MLAALPPLNILVSYPYFDAQVTAILDRVRAVGPVQLLVDSGAFTAWKSGKPIDLARYCAFLRGLPVAPWRYFTLDVIGDGPASMRNYETLLGRGFSPVPVFTRGEDVAMLDRYYETSDLVAIGGLVSRHNQPKPYLKFLQPHLAGRHYHALGFTALEWIKSLRPYSVDSSSWTRAGRFGLLQVYMGRGRLLSLSRKDIAKMTPHAREQVSNRLVALGYDLADFRQDASWRGVSLSRAASLAAWIWLSIDVERRLGTKLFLAGLMSSDVYAPDAYARVLRVVSRVEERKAV